MTEPSLQILLAAGGEGGISPSGAWRIHIPPGPARNRMELRRAHGGPAFLLEGRWLRTVSIAFSADERLIAASGYAGSVAVWSTDTGAAVASFPDVEADPAGDGRLPLLFTRGDEILVCGGRKIAFINTSNWTKARTLDQPCIALRSMDDPLRVAAYELVDNGLTRWVLNVKSFEIEGADRLRETRIYFGLLGGNRKVS